MLSTVIHPDITTKMQHKKSFLSPLIGYKRNSNNAEWMLLPATPTPINVNKMNAIIKLSVNGIHKMHIDMMSIRSDLESVNIADSIRDESTCDAG